MILQRSAVVFGSAGSLSSIAARTKNRWSRYTYALSAVCVRRISALGGIDPDGWLSQVSAEPAPAQHAAVESVMVLRKSGSCAAARIFSAASFRRLRYLFVRIVIRSSDTDP